MPPLIDMLYTPAFPFFVIGPPKMSVPVFWFTENEKLPSEDPEENVMPPGSESVPPSFCRNDSWAVLLLMFHAVGFRMAVPPGYT